MGLEYYIPPRYVESYAEFIAIYKDSCINMIGKMHISEQMRQLLKNKSNSDIKELIVKTVIEKFDDSSIIHSELTIIFMIEILRAYSLFLEDIHVQKMMNVMISELKAALNGEADLIFV